MNFKENKEEYMEGFGRRKGMGRKLCDYFIISNL